MILYKKVNVVLRTSLRHMRRFEIYLQTINKIALYYQ